MADIAFPFSGAKLRKYRAKASISQRELARRVGCHEQEISSYECGTRAPRLERWRAIAKVLEREARDFLEIGAL